MSLFHVIDDAQVIIRNKGVYRQMKVYRRGTEIYAAHGTGFIKLMAMGATSHPNVTWIEVDTGPEDNGYTIFQGDNRKLSWIGSDPVGRKPGGATTKGNS